MECSYYVVDKVLKDRAFDVEIRFIFLERWNVLPIYMNAVKVLIILLILFILIKAVQAL